MSSSSESFKSPKLGGLNYPAWSVHMQSMLQSHEHWLIVTGDEEALEKPDLASILHMMAQLKTMKKEWLEWLSRDQAATDYMKRACKDSQLPYIVECQTSKDMWEWLKTVHQMNQS